MARRGAPMCWVLTWPTKALEGCATACHGSRHRSASITVKLRSRRWLSRRPAGSSMWSPVWKCWSMCPIRASVVQCLRGRWSKPGGWVFLSTLNRNAQVVFVCHFGGRVRAQDAAGQGTHEYARFLQVRPSWRSFVVHGRPCRCRPVAVSCYTALDHQPLQPCRFGHQTSITCWHVAGRYDGGGASVGVAAFTGHHSGRAVRLGRHLGGQCAGSGRCRQRNARGIEAFRRCRYEVLRPMVGARARAACSEVALGKLRQSMTEGFTSK